MKKIIIRGVEIRPGTTKTIELPVSKLYTQTTMTMPVHVKRGKKDGPCLFVSAAIHGDEILGVEIIRRLLKRRVFGFINHTRFLPDRRDLNRFFPGS